MLKSACLGMLGIGLVSAIVVPTLAQTGSDSRAPSSVLSLEEHSRAVQIAAPQATARAFNLDPGAPRTPDVPDREVVSDVQAVGVGTGDSRQAVVTIYRYDGNVSISRLIDIDSGRVLSEERMRGSAAPMADVEIEYASMLLQNNERARALLAAVGDGASYTFRLLTTDDPNNPLFGKRVLVASVSTPEGGFVGGAPPIQVNLTDGAVVMGQ